MIGKKTKLKKETFMASERLNVWCAHLTYRRCCGLCWDSECLTCQTLWHPSDSLWTDAQTDKERQAEDKNNVKTTSDKIITSILPSQMINAGRKY